MVIWCCAITFAKEFMPDAKAVALSRSLDYLRAITHSTLPWCHAGKSAWLGLFFLPPTTFSNMLQIERSQEALPWNWRKFKILEKVNCANSLIIAQLGVFPLETISFWLVAPKQGAKSWNFHLYNQAINSNYLVLNPQLLLLKRKLLFPAKAKNIFNPQWLNRQCHKE